MLSLKKTVSKFNSVPSFRNSCIAVFGAAAALGAGSASAAIGDGAVAAITDAQGKGEMVGEAIVLVVAALAVVGIIIALIRKV